MNVEKKSLRTWLAFKHIAPGVVFMDDHENVLMKIVERPDFLYNAVDIETGEVYDYEEDATIELLDATVVF